MIIPCIVLREKWMNDCAHADDDDNDDNNAKDGIAV